MAIHALEIVLLFSLVATLSGLPTEVADPAENIYEEQILPLEVQLPPVDEKVLRPEVYFIKYKTNRQERTICMKCGDGDGGHGGGYAGGDGYPSVGGGSYPPSGDGDGGFRGRRTADVPIGGVGGPIGGAGHFRRGGHGDLSVVVGREGDSGLDAIRASIRKDMESVFSPVPGK